MLVIHDRHFLKHIANRAFEIDKGTQSKDGENRIYEGDYKYYLSQRLPH
ncbi:MAG: hypothetical protein AABZ55_03200 [Bdellovibrionota bacterium]